jgi:putative aminopeptidase FrvX
MSIDTGLLKTLCELRAPSGNEGPLKQFIINYVKQNQHSWAAQPEIIEGNFIGDAVILKFGKPRTAVFAHMDSIGFTVRYNNGLVKIGGPRTENGFVLVGADSKGEIEAILEYDHENNFLSCTYERDIDRGTELTFKPDFRETENFIQCCYMDNRLGCYIALKTAETLTEGLICFTCYEESGGGNAGVVGKYIYEQYGVMQALISDITWKTEGVEHGKGVALSIRDSGIPRRAFYEKILGMAKESGIAFQLEVEGAGGSDGTELQKSPYPFDWLFIGAPEDFVHTPNEKVHKDDIYSMEAMYKYLMQNL